MSEHPVRAYLTSRRNAFGLGGALVAPVAHLAGLIGDIWPAVSVGLYAAVALVVPPPPPPQAHVDPLIDVLRHEARELRADPCRDLPQGVPAAIARILHVLEHVLGQLDQLSERADDQIAMPRRLAEVDGLLRHDLPECLAVYRARPPASSAWRAAAALVEQLDVIATAADRLAAEVPDAAAERAEDLTRDLRRRHGLA